MKRSGAGVVDGFRMGGKKYLPGDIVELPESYLGSAYLERVVEDPAADIGGPDVAVAQVNGGVSEVAAAAVVRVKKKRVKKAVVPQVRE